MEIIDNALPHIGGEADKMAAESRKLLGSFDGAEVRWHDADVSASCNRIPTLDGHLENVWAELEREVTPEAAAEAMRSLPSLDLPSSPEPFITVFDDQYRPQPRLDRLLGGGMSVSAGGIEAVPSGGLKYNCLAHNTIRGAAGASVLNGELLVDESWL
jgi:aspartate-semialdehyde dehydrogenase